MFASHIRTQTINWTSCPIDTSKSLLGICMRTFALHQCADYAYASYTGAVEVCVARYVCCRRNCLVFVPSHDGPTAPLSPTSISIAKECHRPPSIWVERIIIIWMCQTESDCVMHIYYACNDVLHDIPECDPRTCTYVFWENRFRASR